MKFPVYKKWIWIISAGLLPLIFYLAAEIDLSEIFSQINAPEISVGSIVVLLALATLISEDLTCLSAGALVSQGRLSFALAVFACGFGIFFGDILLYAAGRLFGRKLLETKLFGHLFSEDSLQKASTWLDKYGKSAVLLSRFTFGLRLPIYFIAGTLKTDFLKFASYFAVAVALWTPLVVGLSSLLSEQFLKATVFQNNFQLGFILFVISFYILLRKVLKLFRWKERRLLIGRIKRRLRWEFWSIRVFYVPVVFYIAFLAIKHRSLIVFTCANPGILAGGLIGESKNEIYQGLKKSPAGAKHLLPYVLLKKEHSASKRIALVWRFIDKYKLSFPLVLKPDIGERGKDVKIVRDFLSLKRVLESAKKDYILQKFAAGVETSVFYYRYPGESNGKIFSITEKRFPEATGDGESTLEELILKDDRAICLAERYFEHNSEKLSRIPAKGETVRIIEIGTHSQGAIFLDGKYLKTGKLEKRIDEICRDFEGFYFGRFDIRTRSLEDFRRGENFKIIELNGVSSESTDIYDPRNSLIYAYKVLFRQWEIAFAVGKENCSAGAKSLSLFELIKLVYENLYGRKSGEPVQLQELSKQPNI